MGVPRRTKKLRVKKKRVIEYLDVIFPHWVITPKSNWSKAYSLMWEGNKLRYKYYRAPSDDEREIIKIRAKIIAHKIASMFKEA